MSQLIKVRAQHYFINVVTILFIFFLAQGTVTAQGKKDPVAQDIDLTLAITILESAPYTIDQEITVLYTITNLGTQTVWDGVYITGFLPAELSFINEVSEGNGKNNHNDWRYDETNNTWNVQAIDGKATKTLEIKARVNTTNSFSHTATVDIISKNTQKEQVDLNLANNSPTQIVLLENDVPTAEPVSVTLAAATTEGTAFAISPLSASKAKVSERQIRHFTIASLPNATTGKLYVADKMATEGQQLSEEDAAALSFEPTTAFVGETAFTYTATDKLGATSLAPATYSITMVSSTLPVSLMSFTAQPQQRDAALTWATASERDNDYFEVQRSQDGKNFVAVGNVKGAGNSSLKLTYSFLDTNAPAGVLYYRLKQVDFDGTHSFSKAVTVTTSGLAAAPQVKAYPNPFLYSITVAMPSATTGQAQVRLLDLQGRVVLTQAVFLERGENELELTTDTLPAGAYILTVRGNDIDSNVKVIKS